MRILALKASTTSAKAMFYNTDPEKVKVEMAEYGKTIASEYKRDVNKGLEIELKLQRIISMMLVQKTDQD